MSVKNSLIAIGALSASYCLLSGMKSTGLSAAARPAERKELKAQAAPPSRVLLSPPTQKLTSHQLQEGVTHVYPLPLKAGEKVEVIAYQDGVDLQAALFDPGGQHLFTVDTPNGAKGNERILWVAETSGQYRIEISCSGRSGSYRIWINDQSLATERDKKNAAAEKLFYQAKEEIWLTGVNAPEERLRKAELLWEDIGEAERQADALTRLGVIYHKQSNPDDAFKAFNRAKTLYRGLGRLADEGKTDNSIGVIYLGRQDLISAQKSFQQALDCGERSRDRGVIANSYGNLGALFLREGRAEAAFKSLGQAREVWRGINPEKEAEALVSMGELFVAVGKLVSAKEKYQEALRVLASGKYPGAKALVLLGIGNLYLKTSEPERALRFYSSALAIQQRAGLISVMPTSLNGMADAFLNEGRPQEALASFQKALKIFQAQGDLSYQARVWTNLGWTFAELHQETGARKAFERALTLAKNLDPWTASAARSGLAHLERALGNPIAAQRQAEAAVKVVEDLRASAGSGFRVSFFATKQDPYDTLIEILLWEHSLKPAAGYDAQALRVSEQERSRGLLDSVSAARSGQESRPSPSLSPILSLREIQALLDPDTLLLEYHLGRRASYLWIVGTSSARVIKLPARQELEDRVSRVSQLLQLSRSREKTREAIRAAIDLSRVVLGPALPGLDRKRLVIAAPDALQSVFFGALPDPGIKDPPPGARTWPKPLLVDHEVVSIPSVSVASALHARSVRREHPQGLLAFLGDSVSGDDDERLAGLPGFSPSDRTKKAVAGTLPHFDRLRYTEDEGNAIISEAGHHGVLGAFGFEATRELVTSGQLSAYANLHFATHGIARSDAGSDSALVLSLWDRQGHPVDGFLTASDVSRLDLPADLVALSACDTGLGENVPGEGTVGLSQAFMEAGASRVMVSLWPVEDHATSKLMKRFYQEYLVEGLSPSQALRKTQAEMWKEPAFNAPFYWGGFEIQGDWQWARDPR